MKKTAFTVLLMLLSVMTCYGNSTGSDLSGGYIILCIILGIVALIIFLTVYFLPTTVAQSRNPSYKWFFWLNLFLGFTGIMWIVLLIWATMLPKENTEENAGK